MQNKLKLLGVGLAALMFIGCDSGSKAPASYDAEGYQYKGAIDPLLATSGADRAGPLADRFDLIQGRK